MSKPYKGLVDENGRVFWSRINTKNKSGGNDYWLPDFCTYRKKYFYAACQSASARSRREGLPCDITPEYLEDIFPEDGLCPVLGTPMPLANEPNKHKKPSLDRLIPEKGYVRGNVVWMSLEANRIKNNASLEQLQRVCAFLKRNQNGTEEDRPGHPGAPS